MRNSLIIVFFFLLILPISSSAQQQKGKDVVFYGNVKDEFTGADLNAFITIMSSDGTVVASDSCDDGDGYWIDLNVKKEVYTVRAELEGYQTTTIKFPVHFIGRNVEFELPLIKMKRKAHELKEVTITATKVRMVQHGDTLVFNADAFNVPEGSMLDALIAQLPGTELKSDGEIFVNGRKVDYLTLNGEDFFKGNNKVMLDNLPYYTVKNIKVYNKLTKESRYAGREIDKPDYVMDVNLKKEYNRGYMANVEAGGGNKERYYGKAFLLGYTVLSRLGVYGNMNNVSQQSEMQFNDEWSPDKRGDGEITYKNAGMEYSTKNKEDKWEEKVTAALKYRKAEVNTRTNAQQYAQPQDVYSGTNNYSGGHDYTLSLGNQFTVNKPTFIEWKAGINYDQHKAGYEQTDSTYTLERALNEAVTHEHGRKHTTTASSSINLNKTLPWGDIIGLEAGMTIKSTRNTDDNSRSIIYHQTADGEDRNLRHDDPAHSYKYFFTAVYNIPLSKAFTVTPIFTYTNDYANERDRYYSANGSSAGEPLQTLDSNSRESRKRGNSYDEAIRIGYSSTSSKGTTFYTHLQGGLEERHDRFTLVTPSDNGNTYSFNHLLPSVDFVSVISGGGKNIWINYNMNRTTPDYNLMTGQANTLNPLVTIYRNRALKPTTVHNAMVSFSKSVSHFNKSFGIDADWSATHGSIGYARSYDPATGTYKYMPGNVNGNWNASVSTDYETDFDSKGHFHFSGSTEYDINHSVDFDITGSPDIGMSAPLSRILSHAVSQSVEMLYKTGQFTASLIGSVDWHKVNGKADNLDDFHYTNFHYGVKTTIPLFWKATLNSDLTMYSRRGYSLPEMNDNNLIWNAALSRPFLKNRLLAKLSAIDILHKLSNRSITVNAQGRTETWVNSVPNYVMFSVQFKFSAKPKDK